VDIAYARRLIDEPAESAGWLRSRGVQDVVAGHHALEVLDQVGLTGDLLAVLLEALDRQLPETDDPDLALTALGRFLAVVRSPLAFVALVERDATALTHLLSILGASPLLGRWLIDDPDAFDLLRLTEGQPVDRQPLVDELKSELAVLSDLRAQISLLQR
jgi:glutamate-ammonia-ligase adenylyltransferase